MNQSLALGPLVLPLAFVVLALAVAAGWWSGARIARPGGLRMDGAYSFVLACGLVGARLAFVAAFHDAYAQAPLAILDIRDGGWRPLAGFAAAGLSALALAAWRAPYRRPLAAAWGVAAGVWLAGLGVASLLQPAPPSLPQLTLPSLDGTPVDLARLRGKPLVVNVWASWCPPCRRELPVLQQAQARAAGIEFLFIDQGESAARVQAFLGANRLALRNVLLDADGRAGRQLGAHALPATFLFDARGRLVGRRTGELSPGTLAELLAAIPPSQLPR